MNGLKLAIAVIEIMAAVVNFFQRQRWYQEGKADADAQANAEQKRRIDLANAARADADHIAAGGVPDPHARD